MYIEDKILFDQEKFKLLLIGNKLEIMHNQQKNFFTFSKFLKVLINPGSIDISLKIKKKKSILKSTKSIINQLFFGLQENYTKKVIFKYHHFPIKINFLNNVLEVTNFYGGVEKKVVYVPKNIQYEGSENSSEGFPILSFKSSDKNQLNLFISQIVKKFTIKEKDVRVFQDGLYIFIEKNEQ